MMLATRTAYQRALDKASATGIRSRIKRLSRQSYSVPGEHGTYVVRTDGTEFVCTCPAGRREAACYHAAAIYPMIMLRKAMAEVAR